MINLAISLMWGAGELIISLGAITAFSFLICYGFGAVMEPQEGRFDDVDFEATPKEHTASIFMAAMLCGFHITFVFFGLPLFGHATDPFFLRLIYSCAIIAALTTGVAIGTIIIYMAIPLVRYCCAGLVRLIRRTPAEKDLEAQAESQVFIIDEKSEKE